MVHKMIDQTVLYGTTNCENLLKNQVSLTDLYTVIPFEIYKLKVPKDKKNNQPSFRFSFSSIFLLYCEKDDHTINYQKKLKSH